MNDVSAKVMKIPTGRDLSAAHPYCQGSLGVLPVDGTMWPTSIRPIRVLGHGRAAEARLVQATHETGESVICVEKIFHPGLLTRSIYRAAYQTSFAYQHNSDAIRACFYRRRVAAAIVEAMIPEVKVAQPLYVRWDDTTQALVLASEFIQGRGIIPQDVDPTMIRRWLAKNLAGKSPSAPISTEHEEIEELLNLMTRLESLLIECGLTGSGWQVCKRAMVSTANLLRTESGYVVVDLESGIPSVLVPIYVLQGIRLKSLPLFDDLDPIQLQSWLLDHDDHLAATLGDTRLQQIKADVSSLILHNRNWKLSEPAIGRQPWRLLTSDFRHRFRSQVLARWQRCRIIDEVSAAELQDSRRFFTRSTFLLGLIPGRPGRFFQRVQANTDYRNKVRRWLHDSEYRRKTLSEYAERKTAEWKSNDRVGQDFSHETVSLRFLVNTVLARTTPAPLHRWIVDRVYRRMQWTRIFLFCVSGRFQSEYGRFMIRSRIEHWRDQSRLSDQAADSLTQQLDSTAVDEYVRGFGLHVGLKLLLPVVMPLKVGGAAASLASGNAFYFLFTLMLVPMLRTCVTVWRMMASQRSVSDFHQALLVGILPVVGSLAFPVQMSARFSGLSMFLLRDFASRLGCWLPIYGGKDSRTELMAIKLVNVIAEGLDLWLSLTNLNGSKASSEAEIYRTAEMPQPVITVGRWDRLAAEHIRLMQESTTTSLVLPTQLPVPERRVA